MSANGGELYEVGPWRDRPHRLVLVAIIAGVFANAFGNGATSVDDDALVFENPSIRGFSLRTLIQVLDPRESRANFGLQYAPLSDLSYALDYRLFADDARFYHIQPLAFHTASALLLFRLLRRRGLSPGLALVASALFAVHPVQVESVTWISGRRTAMAGSLALAAVYSWARFRDGAGARFYILSLFSSLAANLSKQSAVAIPLLAAALEFTLPPARQPEAAPGRARLCLFAALAPHFLLAGLFLALGAWIGRREGVILGLPFPPLLRVELLLCALAHYGRLLLWPAGLQPTYQIALPSGMLDLRVFSGLAIALGGAAAALLLRRRAPLASFGLLFAGIALAPGIHGLGTQLVADRYLYLTVAGAAAVAAAAIAALWRRERPVALALSLGALLALGIATALRNLDWRNDVALFTAAVRADPTNGIHRRALGRALVCQGRFEAGERELRHAAYLFRDPPVRGPWALPLTLADIGASCELRGAREEAILAYRAAIGATRPTEPEVAERARRRLRALGEVP